MRWRPAPDAGNAVLQAPPAPIMIRAPCAEAESRMPCLRRTLIHVVSSITLLLLTQVTHAACDFDADAAAANPKSLKVLLIGASGMIGSRILKEATKRGHCVIGASRNPDRIAGGANVRAVM